MFFRDVIDIDRSFRRVVRSLCRGDVASSYIEVEKRALEDAKGRLELVRRHFIAGLVDVCVYKLPC